MALTSSRSSDGGTSDRPRVGTGAVRMRPIRSAERFGSAGPIERRSPGEHRVEGRGQRVHVRPFVAGGSLGEHLGGGPRNRHADRAGGGLRRGTRHRDTEVGQHRVPEVGGQDVGGLDVPVEDAGSVGRLDGARDPDPDAQHLGDGQPLGPIAGGQVGPRAVLHDQIWAAVGSQSGLVDRDDRRMCGQRGHQVRLGIELGDHLVVGGVRDQDLDRHVATREALRVQVDVGESA